MKQKQKFLMVLAEDNQYWLTYYSHASHYWSRKTLCFVSTSFVNFKISVTSREMAM